MRYTVLENPWGSFGFVSVGERLVSTFLPRTLLSLRRLISEHWPSAVDDPDALPSFQRQVEEYFAGKPTRFDVPIDLSGVPPFRAAVLEACRKIPYGKIASYADLARAAGNPLALAFMEFLQSNRARQIVAQYGYLDGVEDGV